MFGQKIKIGSIRFNYANAKNALDYTNAEAELMAPYFEKAIKSKLQGWKVSTVLSPQGYDFPFNSLTVEKLFLNFFYIHE